MIRGVLGLAGEDAVREQEPLHVVRLGKSTNLLDFELNDEIRSDSAPTGDDSATHWRPDPDVVTQLVEGETVLVHLQTNEIYALNVTATRAWGLLAAGMDRDAVQQTLQSEFDVAPEELRREIDTLIGKLVEKQLLRATG